MRRLILVLTIVAGCSLLYDPRGLPATNGAVSDAQSENDLRDASPRDIDASEDASSTHLDAAPPTDAKPPVDARMVDAPMVDAPMPDAHVVDAQMPDAPNCGGTGEVCCAGMTCDPSNECGGGICHHCGGVLESCCDPGMTCNGALSCIAGVCTL